jgi:predicted secreted protein
MSMSNRFLSGTLFAFLLLSLGIASPVQAKDMAHDPDGGDEISVKSDPGGGDEAVKGGLKSIKNDPDGGDEIAPDPDGGDEKGKKMSANEASASGALKTIAG